MVQEFIPEIPEKNLKTFQENLILGEMFEEFSDGITGIIPE